jgi:hypothetical protein
MRGQAKSSNKRIECAPFGRPAHSRRSAAQSQSRRVFRSDCSFVHA